MIVPIIDVSKWQGDIDANKMIGAGAKGLYIKAGGTDKNNGSSYTDRRFRDNAEKFGDHIPIGFYYFFYPHISGAKQGEFFAQLCTSARWNLPPVIDVESNPKNVGQAAFQRQVKAFLDVLWKELNVMGVVYTRASFWNPNVGNPAWAGEHKLWVARYGTHLTHPWNNDPTSPLRPAPWDDYWMWQYSADENRRGKEFGADSHALDINTSNMTEAEFNSFTKWSPGNALPLPEPGGETEPPAASRFPRDGYLREGYSTLRLRTRPTTSENNIVGIIRSGTAFQIYTEQEVGDNLWWLLKLPDGTVGWGAKRYHGITFLEEVV